MNDLYLISQILQLQKILLSAIICGSIITMLFNLILFLYLLELWKNGNKN